MNDVQKQSILSVIRTLLAAAGAWLATHDYIDVDMANEIVGAVMILIPIVWGIWDKNVSEAKTQDREAVALNVGIVVADNTRGPTPRVPKDEVQAVIATAKE